MTERRKELIAALTIIQNHPVHHCHDIITFTGFMDSDDEVAAHIEANIAQISDWANRGGAL